MGQRTILEIIDLSAKYLEERGIASHRREAEQLIADALGLKRLDLYLQFDRPLDSGEIARCREPLRRRGQREPLQYIRGSVDFYDCEIEVTREVLIPRPETEQLVDRIVKELESVELDGKVLWDICTGSGCIGIALKKRFPKLQVALADLSRGALAVARSNAEKNGASVEICCGDLLQPFKGRRADYIVSNPPYAAEGEFAALEPEVRDYEPKMAIVAPEEGYECYRRFAEELPLYLKSPGKAWFEIAPWQGERLVELFSHPCYRQVGVEKDWSGRDRFFFLVIE